MDNPSCPICPGVGRYLGALGNLAHFRCESCGSTFHEEVEEPEDAPESAGHYDLDSCIRDMDDAALEMYPFLR